MAQLEFLNEGFVGNISTNKQAEARQMISEHWENLGFTKGLDGYLKENMATIFENTANALLNEATDANGSGQFQTVVFPLVRRVFSRLLANDIVSVQAMNMPIGKLFFILPVTSEREMQDPDREGDIKQFAHKGLMGYERTNRRFLDESGNTIAEDRYYQPDEVVNDGVEGVTKYFQKSLYDMFYNDGLFDNSKGKKHIHVGEVEAVKLNWRGEVEPLVIASAKTHNDGTIRNLMLKVKGFSPVNAGRLTGPDGNEMDAEEFLASLKVFVGESGITSASGACFNDHEPLHFRAVAQQYGKGLVQYGDICNADGELLIELDLAKPCAAGQETEDGFIGVDKEALEEAQFIAAWAQYDSLELETEIGEVSFKLSDVTVSVTERKLRATWSPELAQDVAAFHNIDAEAELTAILSEQIAAEIDREILRDLRAGSPWQLKWDYNGWRRMAKFSTNYTQKDWNQMLITKINQISAQIHKATLRGGANFIVVSTEISAVMNDLEYFHVTDANAEAVSYSLGIEKIGSLNGRCNVFVDPYAPHWSLIMGHKGDSLLDTGYIYAPYVPMQLTPTIYNAANFAPVKGILTRYAKKMVNSRYYGAIVVNGLQTWNINELR